MVSFPSTTKNLDLLGILVLFNTLLDAEYLHYGITDEVLCLKIESTIAIFNHGAELSPAVWTHVDQDEIFGLGERDAWGKCLNQLVEVGGLLVVGGVVVEGTVGSCQVSLVLARIDVVSERGR